MASASGARPSVIVPPGVFRPPSDAYLLAGLLADHAPGADVLDLCCGSGVLAVAAARAGAGSITAVDVSRRALATAALNGALARRRLRLRRGDLFAAVVGERFDLIIANPPYLPAVVERPRGVQRATEAGFDGRAHLDRLLDAAPGHLRPGGIVLVVHSSVNGVERSLERLKRGGLHADVAARRRGPLGPLLSARARVLEERGLLEPGAREEDVVVVRGRAPSPPRPGAA